MNISRWPKADTQWYLGVRCRKCRLPILFALDRSDGTGKQEPLLAGKLVLTCPLDDCRHQADYTGTKLSRFQKQPGKPDNTATPTKSSKKGKRGGRG